MARFCIGSTTADRTIFTIRLIYEYIQSTTVDQPATVVQPTVGGWLLARDHFPQVHLPPAGVPGAMQGLIRCCGSVGVTISVKKVIHNFHQQPFEVQLPEQWTVDCGL